MHLLYLQQVMSSIFAGRTFCQTDFHFQFDFHLCGHTDKHTNKQTYKLTKFRLDCVTKTSLSAQPSGCRLAANILDQNIQKNPLVFQGTKTYRIPLLFQWGFLVYGWGGWSLAPSPLPRKGDPNGTKKSRTSSNNLAAPLPFSGNGPERKKTHTQKRN